MKKLLWLLSVLILFIAALSILFKISKSSTFQFFGELIPRVNTSEKVVALTFDDGPTVERTDRVLEVLASENVKATFFVIGGELDQNLAEGRKIVAAGHELGNHSYSHVRMLLVSPSFVKDEIERTDKLIKDAGYQGEILFRPPYGKKLFALPYYLSQHNRKTVTWDVEPDSYPAIANDPDKITQHVLANTRPGSIIILHVMYSNRDASFKAVKSIIQGLKRSGYRFTTASELIALQK